MNANPGLDYELGTRQYLLEVVVYDGYFTVKATLTVNIDEHPEPPVLTNLPGTLSLKETDTGTVFTVTATDEDVGDVVTLSSTVSPTPSPFTLNPTTGNYGLYHNYACLDLT